MKRSRLKDYRERSKKVKKKSRSVGFFIILPLIFTTFLSAFVFIRINLLEKYVFVNKVEGITEVVAVDVKSDKLVRLELPENTEVNAARDLGVYKLGNLWVLGEKEGYGGKLVAESIVKNFNLPVYLWKNNGRGNLNLYQRVHLRLLDWGVFRMDEIDLDITKTNSLKRKVFEDGTSGFTVPGGIPDSLNIYFLDNYIAESNLKIEIADLSGTAGVGEKVASVIEAMGLKIYTNSRGYNEGLDCEVWGKDAKAVSKIALILGCTTKVEDIQSAADIKISLGQEFADRF